MRLAIAQAVDFDIATILEFVSTSDPQQGRKTVLAIQHAAQKLAGFPHIGRPGRILGTRELILTDYPYILVYTADENTVTVVAVLHAARDIASAMRGRVPQT